ncbi:MAG: phage/plasmid replication protein [Methylococcales bacterium]|nr:phage/plasmid replication protein [Methylococcales bacterium]
MIETPVFIDWIYLAQTHAAELPLVGGTIRAKSDKVEHLEVDGVKYLVMSNDKEKAAPGYTISSIQHQGSHDTKVITRCEGSTVTLSGNVGRLDRPDNIFNYVLDETITKASAVVNQYGLPSFTAGTCHGKSTLSEHDRDLGLWTEWTGAVMRELHVTQNFSTGSEAIAKEVMNYMGGLRAARIAKGRYGDESIVFGHLARKGKRMHKAIVVYRKAAEMLAHAKGQEAKKRVKASEEYQLAHETGLVRIECKWGTDYLRDNKLRFIGEATMTNIISLFKAETNFLLNASPDRTARVIADLPPKVRSAALHWIRGDDLRLLMSRATFYRMIKALAHYGIDASEPRRVDGRPNSEAALQCMLDALPVFELRPLVIPDWYVLPEIRNAA